jgi:hypothetical protein
MKAGMGEMSAAAATQGREADEEGDHGGEGDERAAEPEDAGDHVDRPPRRFALRLLELVVVLGVLEVGQVERGGVTHDLELDVDRQPLLQQLLADVRGRLQEARAEQQRELDDRDDDDGAHVLRRAAGGDAGDDLVDQATGQPDLGGGHHALQEGGAAEGGGQLRAGGPDEGHDTDDALPRLPRAASDGAQILAAWQAKSPGPCTRLRGMAITAGRARVSIAAGGNGIGGGGEAAAVPVGWRAM